jgi:predicted PurR-regulated permease PerM
MPAQKNDERLLVAVRILWLVILGGFVLYEILRFLIVDIPFFTIVVVGALFFAYLIHPVVSELRRRMHVVWAIVVLYAGIGLILSFAVYVVWPPIAADAQSIAHDFPRIVATVEHVLTNPHDPFTAHLPVPVRNFILSIPSRIERDAGRYGASLATTAVPVLFSVVAFVALFIIIPIVAAYMTAEARSVKRVMLAFFPRSARMRVGRIIADLDDVVGGFIRGQILVAIIVGSLITLLLFGLHVRYAVLIGAVAGVLDVIPYVGAVSGWLPAFVISFVNNGIENSLAVTAGIIVINQIEGHLIVPNVVSRTVALTPLGVMLALLFGGEVLGLPGLLVAVPVAGAIRVLAINLVWPDRRRYLRRQERQRNSWIASGIRAIAGAIERSRARRESAGRHRPTDRSP